MGISSVSLPAAIAQEVGHPVDQHRGLAAARAPASRSSGPSVESTASRWLVVEVLIVQGDRLLAGPRIKRLLQFVHGIFDPLSCCFPLF